MAHQPQQPHDAKTQPVASHHVSLTESDDRVWDSSTLFGETREVMIRHEGVLYRLRKTRNGRLILQK